jgi:hypothetical protein
MDDTPERESPIVFRVGQALYIAAVLAALAFLGAMDGAEMTRAAASVLGSLFLIGGLWVAFSERASHSTWIKGCVYFSFAVLAIIIVATPNRRGHHHTPPPVADRP